MERRGRRGKGRRGKGEEEEGEDKLSLALESRNCTQYGFLRNMDDWPTLA